MLPNNNPSISPTLQQIQQALLENQSFIEQIKNKISQCSSLEVHSKIEDEKWQPDSLLPSSLKYIKKGDLDQIITEISQLLNDLITQKLEYELNEIIQQNNNILLQIKENLILQQKQNLNDHNKILEEDKAQMSFSDVHRLIAQEKKRFENFNGDGVNDAELQKSISSLVEYKFESIEEKVVCAEKRLKAMQDKYETNLKSIWNVLSMTESAVFDFINKQREKEKKEAFMKDIQNEERKSKVEPTEKKSTFFKLW